MCYNLQARGVSVIKYRKGEIVKGCVTGIENYGAFVGLDEYYSGLIHISEISDGFVSDIHNFLEIGETIYVKVLDVDDENYQVKLSIKNIDYKVRKKRTPIKESITGFQPLENILPEWINSKINEINSNGNV